MKVYELTLKIFLLKDLTVDKSYEKLSELIDKSLCKDEELLILHNENKYKYYTFHYHISWKKTKYIKQETYIQ